MRVIELMTRPAVVCGEHETLNTAARKMWEHDCAALPVIGADRKLIGILTDRDICMAAYAQGTALHEIRVSNAMANRVVSWCRAEDDIEQAELRMRSAHMRRLPVVDADGRVVGVVSLRAA